MQLRVSASRAMLTFALLVVVVALSAATPASAQTQNLGLLWDPVPSGNIDHYNVYVGTSPGVHDVLTVQVPASTMSYAFDATPGILYYFAVSAVDSSGIEGPLSLEIDGSIPDFFPIIDRSSTSGVSITPMNLLAYDPDGDVLRYTHTGLPLGLTLSSSGVISGVPVSTGSFNVTIQVSDGIFIRSRSFVWTIVQGVAEDNAAPALTITSQTDGQTVSTSSITLLSVTSLTSSLASPQAAGTSIRFTAAVSGGTAPHEFKWWIYDGTAWFVAREWGSSASFTWQPSTPGDYIVAVWARNAGVTTDASQALAQVNYTVASSATTAFSSTAAASPLSVTSLTSSVASPQQANTSITFTAAATGGSAPYQFKWWIYDGSAWWVAQDWSMSQTLAWFPSTAGSYIVAVWARNAGVFADASQAMAQINYVVTSSDLPVISSFTSDLSSPQMTGTDVTFTAGVVGGSGLYQSKWWVYDGTAWSVAQNWTTTTTFTWRPGLAGNYDVAVWVRNAGVTADASQALAQVNYVVASQTVPVVSSLTANLASPQMAGTAVTFTASVVGGISPYQYKWWVYDGTGWWVAREWSTSRRLIWQPTIPASYMVAVWVRNAGVTLDASQALAQIEFDVN